MLSQKQAPSFGGEKSDPAPTYTSSSTTTSGSKATFQTRFASVSLHSTDKIRFLRFPPEVISACTQAVAAVWKRGIQDTRPYAGSHEIKLNGNPWNGVGDQAIEARRLLCALLRILHTNGWVLTLNTDVSKSTLDKDSLLFRHQVPAPAVCEWGSIAFSKQDRIRFIDLPPEISRLAATVINRSLISKQSLFAPGVNEIKLNGTPWLTSGTSTMVARELLLNLLDTLEEEGWSVYASIDQENGGSNHSETDTWHCCRPLGWVKGAPVYHN